jgi:hypothetical protein
MALFGLMKKKQVLQQPMQQDIDPFNTSGGRYGDFANQVEQDKPMIQQHQVLQQPMQQDKFKPNVLGVIGDAMQVFAGGQASYMPQMRQQQQIQDMQRQQASQYQMQQQQKMEQSEIDRENTWQDYVRKQEYERANPAPVNNDTVNDFNFYKGLGQEDRDIYQQMRPQFIPDGMGGGQWATPGRAQPQGLDISQGLPAGFKVKGGQTSQASGNFRPQRIAR